MPPVFAVCDLETEFAIRFMEYLNGRNLPFEVQMFTRPDKLCEYGKNKHIELLLISERAMSEEIRSLDVGQTVLLSEEADVSFEELPTVYKYQSGTQLVREVLDCYSAERAALQTAPGSRLRCGRICGVYSLADPTEQMLFTLACGQILAETKSVLYLNLQKYTGLEQLADDPPEGDLSDLLYLFRSGQKDLSCKTAGMIRHIGKLEYVPVPFCSEDLGEMSGEEWQQFLKELGGACGHDVVLLDLGDAVRGLPEILRQCTDRWLLSEEDLFSLRRRQLLEKEWLLDETVRWFAPPPAGAAREGRWFLETLPQTPLGDYVRRNVTNGF